MKIMFACITFLKRSGIAQGVFENVEGFGDIPRNHDKSALTVFKEAMTKPGYFAKEFHICQSDFAPCVRKRTGRVCGKRQCRCSRKGKGSLC